MHSKRNRARTSNCLRCLTSKNPSSKILTGSNYNDLPGYIGILGNLKVSKKATGNLNPLVEVIKAEKTMSAFDSLSLSMNVEETHPKFKNRRNTNLLDIKRASDKSVSNYKCCQ
jgi:hypothetical protein